LDPFRYDAKPFAVDGFNTHHKFSGLFRSPQVVISAETFFFAGVKSMVVTISLGIYSHARIRINQLSACFVKTSYKELRICKRDKKIFLEICILYREHTRTSL